MCGITGFFGLKNQVELESIARKMTDSIAYRGPDDDGVWVDGEFGVALGHRRLSVLELSSAGHQPMVSENNRFVLVFNGEIYNHLILRNELESQGYNFNWQGHSDTETIIACFQSWGVAKTLKSLSGMFALALWDQFEKRLYLARDPMGEKPIYYGFQQGVFLFGSELKSLKANPSFDAEVCRDALDLLLRHNYIPAPFSIYKNIYKLEPGQFLIVSPVDSIVEVNEYWSLTDVALDGCRHRLDEDSESINNKVHETLRQAVKEQMLADVPLGALLSGGLDSTTIVALMQDMSPQRVKTFTIGFEESGYDETSHARIIASHLGTDHTEMRLSSKDALNLIPLMPEIYDEPFADSSQLPTYLVMRLAKQSVTVALSGDGGDELFGGYNRYMLAPNVWKTVKWLPSSGRKVAGTLLQWFMLSKQTKLMAKVTGKSSLNNWALKIDKLSQRLKTIHSPNALYQSLVSEWSDLMPLVKGVSPTIEYKLGQMKRWPDTGSFVENMMLLDGLTYMPDDILTKVDRAAMAVSLETRAPFLNKKLVELAWRIPVNQKIIKGKGKQHLRTVLDNYVPREMVERPKVGFGIPLDDWLRGELRDWASDLLNPVRLHNEGFFHVEPITRVWSEHLSGKVNHGYKLWSVLMFQQWYDANFVK